ncbi:hypothetical protein HI914_01122 [Erysiphe necator]|nr:hypothetical protein HI914_01122 [Erysiphe necator]
MKTFVRLREQLGAQDTKVLIEVKKNEKHKVDRTVESAVPGTYLPENNALLGKWLGVLAQEEKQWELDSWKITYQSNVNLSLCFQEILKS